MLKEMKIDNTRCPICGKQTYISKDDYACSDKDCVFSIGNTAYMNKFSLEEYMQHQIDSYNNQINLDKECNCDLCRICKLTPEGEAMTKLHDEMLDKGLL